MLTTGGGIVYQNNLYFGSAVQVPAGDSAADQGRPQAGLARHRPERRRRRPGLRLADGYKLQAGSPAINAGATVSDNGGLDFWGDALYAGSPDVGAYEAPGQ